MTVQSIAKSRLKMPGFSALIALLAGLSPVSIAAAAESVQAGLEQNAENCSLDPEYRQHVEMFYRVLGNQPVWTTSARIDGLLSELEDLVDDGLQPDEYLPPVSKLPVGAVFLPTCAELAATQGYLKALWHLAHGRFSQAEVEPSWHAESARQQPDVDQFVAAAVRGVDELDRIFDQMRPPVSQYRALREVYARWRRDRSDWSSAISSGSLIWPGAMDDRVPALRARLLEQGYLELSSNGFLVTPNASDLYDAGLVEAVRRFQKDHTLQPDGIVGPQTLAELNQPAMERLRQLQVNLERWRWLENDVATDMVLVDVAGARIALYRDGEVAWESRIQVGRPERPTPLLVSNLSHLTLNPAWTVPPTIVEQDILPEIRRDPRYLEQQQLRVIDYQGRQLDPATIDWNDTSGWLLRQQPGPDNPLGAVVFRFANPFAVYLHDTPSRESFSRLPRATSSGCVRVEDAAALVDLLLQGLTDDQRTSVEELRRSGSTGDVKLPEVVPLLVAYWTAEANPQGRVVFRPDIYDMDASLKERFMNLDEMAPAAEVVSLSEYNPVTECTRWTETG